MYITVQKLGIYQKGPKNGGMNKSAFGRAYSGPMEFYLEIAAHRVGGSETLWDLGNYGLSNVWATGRSIVISLKKASRPHTFDTRQVFRVINIAKITADNTAIKNARGKVTFCELRALFLIRNIDSFRPLPLSWWTQRREDLSKVLSKINWNSGCVNELKGIR